MTLNVLIYLQVPSPEGRELATLAKSSLAGSRVMVFSDLEEFIGWIPAPKQTTTVAIIWNPTPEDLKRIQLIRDLLAGIRLVLVLADDKPETIAMAHKVMPAFVAYTDDGLSEIVSVLERLAGTAEIPAPESRL